LWGGGVSDWEGGGGEGRKPNPPAESNALPPPGRSAHAAVVHRLIMDDAPTAAVQVWEVAAGRVVQTLRGHTAAVGRLAFSPDGRRLAPPGTTARFGCGTPRPVSKSTRSPSGPARPGPSGSARTASTWRPAAATKGSGWSGCGRAPVSDHPLAATGLTVDCRPDAVKMVVAMPFTRPTVVRRRPGSHGPFGSGRPG
jgi:hypothetical protein